MKGEEGLRLNVTRCRNEGMTNAERVPNVEFQLARHRLCLENFWLRLSHSRNHFDQPTAHTFCARYLFSGADVMAKETF